MHITYINNRGTQSVLDNITPDTDTCIVTPEPTAFYTKTARYSIDYTGCLNVVTKKGHVRKVGSNATFNA
jgi:hypothetical protein